MPVIVKAMSRRAPIGDLWNSIQTWLFPLLEDELGELDYGEKNSQSKKECWRGYKLHLDVIDGDIPVSAILTSASLHDSQVAIPWAHRIVHGPAAAASEKPVLNTGNAAAHVL